MIEVFYSALFGIIAGAVYGVGYFFRMASNFNKIITIFIDIAVSMVAGILFVYCSFIITAGIVRIYHIIAFMLGFGIERISIGNLFANILSLVYNKITNRKRKVSDTLCDSPGLQQ